VEQVGVVKDRGGQSETRIGKRSWGSGLGPHVTVDPEKDNNVTAIFIPINSYSCNLVRHTLHVNGPELSVIWHRAGVKPAQNCVR
jgi:hypothetical protein